MIKKIFILLFIVLLKFASHGQVKKMDLIDPPSELKLETAISKKTYKEDIRSAIVRAILNDTVKHYLSRLPVDQTHLLTIAVSFDSVGKAGSVYLPNKIPSSLVRFLGPLEPIKSAIIGNLRSYTNHKNEVLILPILFHNADHKSINKYSLIAEFVNMWPEVSAKDSAKRVVLLEPYDRWISIRY